MRMRIMSIVSNHRVRRWAFLVALLTCCGAHPGESGPDSQGRSTPISIQGRTIRSGFLDLSLSGATDADLAPLDRANGLRGLDLFGTRVGAIGLAHLERATDLRALYLESTLVDDDALVYLERLPMLETLTLSGTRVSDAGLVHLKKLSALRALDISYTKVTETGVAELRRTVPGAVIND
jgi:hypothetical protein